MATNKILTGNRLTEEQQKARVLKDSAASMLSGYQGYTEGEYTFEELLDWFEIDAAQVLKRVEKFREVMENEVS